MLLCLCWEIYPHLNEVCKRHWHVGVQQPNVLWKSVQYSSWGQTRDNYHHTLKPARVRLTFSLTFLACILCPHKDGKWSKSNHKLHPSIFTPFIWVIRVTPRYDWAPHPMCKEEEPHQTSSNPGARPAFLFFLASVASATVMDGLAPDSASTTEGVSAGLRTSFKQIKHPTQGLEGWVLCSCVKCDFTHKYKMTVRTCFLTQMHR